MALDANKQPGLLHNHVPSNKGGLAIMVCNLYCTTLSQVSGEQRHLFGTQFGISGMPSTLHAALSYIVKRLTLSIEICNSRALSTLRKPSISL